MPVLPLGLDGLEGLLRRRRDGGEGAGLEPARAVELGEEVRDRGPEDARDRDVADGLRAVGGVAHDGDADGAGPRDVLVVADVEPLEGLLVELERARGVERDAAGGDHDGHVVAAGRRDHDLLARRLQDPEDPAEVGGDLDLDPAGAPRLPRQEPDEVEDEDRALADRARDRVARGDADGVDGIRLAVDAVEVGEDRGLVVEVDRDLRRPLARGGAEAREGRALELPVPAEQLRGGGGEAADEVHARQEQPGGHDERRRELVADPDGAHARRPAVAVELGRQVDVADLVAVHVQDVGADGGLAVVDLGAEGDDHVGAVAEHLVAEGLGRARDGAGGGLGLVHRGHSSSSMCG